MLQNYLESSVRRMWKVMTKIVSVTTGALRTIKKEFDQNLQLLPGHKLVIKLPKITPISTAHTIHKVLGYIALITC